MMGRLAEGGLVLLGLHWAVASAEESQCSGNLTKLDYTPPVGLTDFHRSGHWLLTKMEGGGNLSTVVSRVEALVSGAEVLGVDSVWRLCKTQTPLFVCLLLALLFVIFVPLVGLCCCCSWCCCSKAPEKASGKWRRRSLETATLVTLAGMLIVCVFAGLNSQAFSLTTYNTALNHTETSAIQFLEELNCTAERVNASLPVMEAALVLRVEDAREDLHRIAWQGLEHAQANLTAYVRAQLKDLNRTYLDVKKKYNETEELLKDNESAFRQLQNLSAEIADKVDRVESLAADPMGELGVTEASLNASLTEYLDDGPLKKAIHENVGRAGQALEFLSPDRLRDAQDTVHRNGDLARSFVSEKVRLEALAADPMGELGVTEASLNASLTEYLDDGPLKKAIHENVGRAGQALEFLSPDRLRDAQDTVHRNGDLARSFVSEKVRLEALAADPMGELGVTEASLNASLTEYLDDGPLKKAIHENVGRAGQALEFLSPDRLRDAQDTVHRNGDLARSFVSEKVRLEALAADPMGELGVTEASLNASLTEYLDDGPLKKAIHENVGRAGQALEFLSPDRLRDAQDTVHRNGDLARSFVSEKVRLEALAADPMGELGVTEASLNASLTEYLDDGPLKKAIHENVGRAGQALEFLSPDRLRDAQDTVHRNGDLARSFVSEKVRLEALAADPMGELGVTEASLNASLTEYLDDGPLKKAIHENVGRAGQALEFLSPDRLRDAQDTVHRNGDLARSFVSEKVRLEALAADPMGELGVTEASLNASLTEYLDDGPLKKAIHENVGRAGQALEFLSPDRLRDAQDTVHRNGDLARSFVSEKVRLEALAADPMGELGVTEASLNASLTEYLDDGPLKKAIHENVGRAGQALEFLSPDRLRDAQDTVHRNGDLARSFVSEKVRLEALAADPMGELGVTEASLNASLTEYLDDGPLKKAIHENVGRAGQALEFLSPDRLRDAQDTVHRNGDLARSFVSEKVRLEALAADPMGELGVTEASLNASLTEYLDDGPLKKAIHENVGRAGQALEFLSPDRLRDAQDTVHRNGDLARSFVSEKVRLEALAADPMGELGVTEASLNASLTEYLDDGPLKKAIHENVGRAGQALEFLSPDRLRDAQDTVHRNGDLARSFVSEKVRLEALAADPMGELGVTEASLNASLTEYLDDGPLKKAIHENVGRAGQALEFLSPDRLRDAQDTVHRNGDLARSFVSEKVRLEALAADPMGELGVTEASLNASLTEYLDDGPLKKAIHENVGRAGQALEFLSPDRLRDAQDTVHRNGDLARSFVSEKVRLEALAADPMGELGVTEASLNASLTEYLDDGPLKKAIHENVGRAGQALEFLSPDRLRDAQDTVHRNGDLARSFVSEKVRLEALAADPMGELGVTEASLNASLTEYLDDGPLKKAIHENVGRAGQALEFLSPDRLRDAQDTVHRNGDLARSFVSEKVRLEALAADPMGELGVTEASLNASLTEYLDDGPLKKAIHENVGRAGQALEFLSPDRLRDAQDTVHRNGDLARSFVSEKVRLEALAANPMGELGVTEASLNASLTEYLDDGPLKKAIHENVGRAGQALEFLSPDRLRDAQDTVHRNGDLARSFVSEKVRLEALAADPMGELGVTEASLNASLTEYLDDGPLKKAIHENVGRAGQALEFLSPDRLRDAQDTVHRNGDLARSFVSEKVRLEALAADPMGELGVTEASLNASLTEYLDDGPLKKAIHENVGRAGQALEFLSPDRLRDAQDTVHRNGDLARSFVSEKVRLEALAADPMGELGVTEASLNASLTEYLDDGPLKKAIHENVGRAGQALEFLSPDRLRDAQDTVHRNGDLARSFVSEKVRLEALAADPMGELGVTEASLNASLTEYLDDGPLKKAIHENVGRAGQALEFLSPDRLRDAQDTVHRNGDLARSFVSEKVRLEALAADPMGELGVTEASLNASLTEYLDDGPLKKAIHENVGRAGQALEFLSPDRLRDAQDTVHRNGDLARSFVSEKVLGPKAESVLVGHLGLVVLGVLILPVVCVMFFALCGLLCGGTLKRTSLANTSIRCSAGLFFVFGWLGMLLTIALFLTGFSVNYGCKVVFESDADLVYVAKRLASNETMATIQDQLGIRNLSASLEACRRGDSLRDVLPVIDRKLHEAQEQVNRSLETQLANVGVKYTETKREIFDQLNFTLFQEDFKDAIDIGVAATAKLRRMANDSKFEMLTLMDPAKAEKAKAELRSLADKMENLTEELTKLKEKEMSKTNVEDVLSGALDPVRDRLVDELRARLPPVVEELTANVSALIPTCQPVILVLNNLQTTVCKEVGYPLNGLWLSTGLLVLLCVPLLLCLLPLTKHFHPDRPLWRGYSNDSAVDAVSLATDSSSYIQYDSSQYSHFPMTSASSSAALHPASPRHRR